METYGKELRTGLLKTGREDSLRKNAAIMNKGDEDHAL